MSFSSARYFALGMLATAVIAGAARSFFAVRFWPALAVTVVGVAINGWIATAKDRH
jgi:hypothetical protein